MVLRSLLGRSQASGAEVDAAAVADREARLQRRYGEIMEEYAEAEYFDPKPYRELSIGEAKAGRTPAVEFMSRNASMRVYALMGREEMRRAALIRSLGMRYDDLDPEQVAEIIDLKPGDRPGMEYGAINLGPVPELIDASGTQWRLFIELAYNAASGSGRRGNVTRRFILDCVL